MQKNRFQKRPWSQPLADLVAKAIDPVLVRQGFGESSLILHWEDIVGERLAAMTQPIKLQWQRRGQNYDPEGSFEPTSLVVRVETGFALELQHLSGVVIERVNAHLGWRCVGRLLLKQGPIDRLSRAKPPRPALDPATTKVAEQMVTGIADDGLRQALTRLGARVLAGT
jgi:hypothetical protein